MLALRGISARRIIRNRNISPLWIFIAENCVPPWLYCFSGSYGAGSFMESFSAASDVIFFSVIVSINELCSNLLLQIL